LTTMCSSTTYVTYCVALNSCRSIQLSIRLTAW